MNIPALDKYFNLRNKIDELSANLNSIHNKHIVCQKGCYDCCLNLKVFAVEFYAILSQMRKDGLCGIEFDKNELCGFLRAGLCIIYPYRPIICRTHGLPIAFSEDSGLEKSVSFCPKNFCDIDCEDFQFNSDNVLDIDIINAQLCQINAEFLSENAVDIDENGRIDLEKIRIML